MNMAKTRIKVGQHGTHTSLHGYCEANVRILRDSRHRMLRWDDAPWRECAWTPLKTKLYTGKPDPNQPGRGRGEPAHMVVFLVLFDISFKPAHVGVDCVYASSLLRIRTQPWSSIEIGSTAPIVSTTAFVISSWRIGPLPSK